MCFVYLTQCKVKKLQRRAKKTNRCSNGSTSPHLCFHRTDIHSIRSQFRHSPPMIVHFRHSKCASLPRYGQGGKGELYIEFFHLLYVMLFSIFYARHRNYYLKGKPGNYLTTIISQMSVWIYCLSLFSPSLPPRLGALAGSQAGGLSTTTVESPSGGVLPQLHTYART